jgi:hypothetical protein
VPGATTAAGKVEFIIKRFSTVTGSEKFKEVVGGSVDRFLVKPIAPIASICGGESSLSGTAATATAVVGVTRTLKSGAATPVIALTCGSGACSQVS